MGKKIYYVCHPVAGDELGNCTRAERWLRWLFHHDSENVYVAPWVGQVRAMHSEPSDDQDWTPGSPDWERVIADDIDVLHRLDGVLLVGGRISRGMARERAAAVVVGKKVLDLSHLETPDHLVATLLRLNETFHEYCGFATS